MNGAAAGRQLINYLFLLWRHSLNAELVFRLQFVSRETKFERCRVQISAIFLSFGEVNWKKIK